MIKQLNILTKKQRLFQCERKVGYTRYIWSFAKKAGLCTPCAVSAVCYTGSRPGAHKGSRHGAHKVCTSHGAHKGAHKYKACAHLVPGTHSEVVRTRKCTMWNRVVRTMWNRAVRTMVCTTRSDGCAQGPWDQRNFCKLPHVYTYVHMSCMIRIVEGPRLDEAFS